MDKDFKTLQAVARDGDIFFKGTILRKINLPTIFFDAMNSDRPDTLMAQTF